MARPYRQYLKVVIPAQAGIQVMKTYYVYILASTLYIGVTNDLKRRVYEHKQKSVEGFTKEYNVNNLVWYEQTEDINSAITKEKQLKKWKRSWKIKLIEEIITSGKIYTWNYKYRPRFPPTRE